jgi:hypothetical protein
MFLAGLKGPLMMAGVLWKSGREVCGSEREVKEKRRRNFILGKGIQCNPIH